MSVTTLKHKNRHISGQCKQASKQLYKISDTYATHCSVGINISRVSTSFQAWPSSLKGVFRRGADGAVHVPIWILFLKHIYSSACKLVFLSSLIYVQRIDSSWWNIHSGNCLLQETRLTYHSSLVSPFYFLNTLKAELFCCLTEFWRVCAILYKVTYLAYYFIFLWIKCEQTIVYFLQLFTHKRPDWWQKDYRLRKALGKLIKYSS